MVGLIPQGKPGVAELAARPVELQMAVLGAAHPIAVIQLVIPEVIGHAVDAVSALPNRVEAHGVEVIVVVPLHVVPAGGQHADLGIPQARLIGDEARILHLSGAHAVLAEVIVECAGAVGRRNLPEPGDLLAVLIVAVLDPAGDGQAVRIELAVGPQAAKGLAAVFALQNAVCKSVAVARSLQGSAPVHNGAAHCAVGPAGVAALGAGCRLVGYGLRSMDMAAVPGIVIGLALCGGDHILGHLVHLGVHLGAFPGEGGGGPVRKGDHAPVDLHADVNGPELLHGLELRIGIGLLALLRAAAVGVAHLQLPGPDGQGGQYALAGGLVDPGAGDGDGGDVLVVLDGIRGLKAGGHGHMVQLPAAHIVQVDVHRDGLDLLQIRRHKVRIPDRAQENLIQRGILRHDLHRGLAGVRLHLDGADHGGVVALVVANGELDVMEPVRQADVGNRNHAALKGAGVLHAVHIGLRRGGIQAGVVFLAHIVGDLRAEAHRAIRDGLPVQGHGVGHGGRRIGHIAEHRGLPVLHCVGIVHGDVVNVHHIAAIVGLMLVVIIVVGRAVPVGDIELDNVAVQQVQALILAQIDGQVVPAGLLILVDEAGGRSQAVAQGICNRFASTDILAVVIQNQRVNRVADPGGDVLVRDVDPHPQLGGVLKFLLAALVLQGGHHIAGLQGVAIVDVQSHGAVAAVDLAGLPGNGVDLALGQNVVIRNIAQVKHTGIAVFEVEDHVGALAELDQGGGAHLRADHGGGDLALGHFPAARSEAQARDGADGLLLQGEADVAVLKLDLVQAVGRSQLQAHGLAEGHGDRLAGEGQLLRKHGVDRHGAHRRAVILGGQGHIPGGPGRQHAVFIGAVVHGIGQLPGDLGGGARRGHAGHGDPGGGAGGHVLVLGGHGHMVKHVGGSRRGGNDQTGGDGALGAVGGAVDDAHLVRALGPGRIGGGAAAVQVDGRHAAGLQHDLGQLVHGAAAGEGLLPAVQDHHDHLALCGDAHAGAGVAGGGVVAAVIAGDVHAVPDQPLVAGGRLPDGAVAVGVHILAQVRAVVDDRRLAVLQDGEEVVVIRRAEAHAVNEGDAHGLAGGHVVEGGVHARHYIIIFADEQRIVRIGILLVGIGDLIAQLLHAHDLILMLLEIRGLDDYVVPGNVRSGHIVHHLLAVLGVGVVDILLHAGGQGGFRVPEYIVGLRGIAALHSVPIGLGRQGRAGEEAEHHGYAEQHCQDLLC